MTTVAMQHVSFWCGLLVGLSIAIALCTGWALVGNAALEWLAERLIDRPPAVSEGECQDGQQEILVSDLHIDTWSTMSNSREADSRANRFLDFLSYIRESEQVQGFILNGDLMDIPQYSFNLTPQQNSPVKEIATGIPEDDGILNPILDLILQPLFTLRVNSNKLAPANEDGSEATRQGVARAIYQTGNHDIGMEGARYFRRWMPAHLPEVPIAWNPQMVITGPPKATPAHPDRRSLYLEHGHYYDPVLWTYLRGEFLDIMRGGGLRGDEKFVRVMQRHGRQGQDKYSRRPMPAGNRGVVPQAVRPVRTMRYAPQDAASKPVWDFADEKRTFGEHLVMLRYRFAARCIFMALRWRRRHDVQTVTFGHTHLPDRYVFRKGQTYINSGDWCGATPHQCYCVICANGSVLGPFQWKDCESARFGKGVLSASEPQ